MITTVPPAMFAWLSTISIILFSILVVAIMKKRLDQMKRPEHLPTEGPPGYPLFGHLHLFRARAYPNLFQMMSNWAKEYGQIYPLSFGPKKIYIVNGYDLISQVFNNPDVDGRTPSHTFVNALGEGKGPASSQGKSRICQRHYAHGFFSNSNEFLERAVSEEATIISSMLSAGSEESVDFNIEHDLYRPALYNIFCQMSFGKRLDFDGDDFRVFAKALDTIFDNPGPATFNYSSYLHFGPSKLIRDQVRELKTLLLRLINERRECLERDPSSASCYVDKYLLMQRNSAVAHHFTDENLLWAIFEMIVGGTNIPKSALSSLLVYLINNPKVQARCQEEIDAVLGPNPPSYADRQRLPYLQATIAESMRMANVTPLAVPRVATKNVRFGDFEFPEGTIFMSNLDSILMDADIFPDPETFNPGRFLDEEGNYHRPKELTPFGVGMRSCLGENLAWMELFLITATLLQKFNLYVPEGEDPPTVTIAGSGVSRGPLPFRVRVQHR